MRWQTIVRRISDNVDKPTGVGGMPVTLRQTSDGSVLAQATTDSSGLALLQINGTPGSSELTVTGNATTRLQRSSVRGPAGPTDVSEMRHILHAIGGGGGAGVVPGFGQQCAASPGAGRSVTIATGQVIIPGGFLHTMYAPTTLTLTAPASGYRIDAIVADADNVESNATYGRTRLLVVTGSTSPPAITGARTLLAQVTVRAASATIATADISQSGMPLALGALRQSRPVLTTTFAAPVGEVVSASTGKTYQATLALEANITYDIVATGNVVLAGSGTANVSLTIRSGAGSTLDSQTMGLSIASTMQTAAVSAAASGVTGGQTITVDMLTLPTVQIGAYGAGIDVMAVPRS